MKFFKIVIKFVPKKTGVMLWAGLMMMIIIINIGPNYFPFIK
jgi:hypothetical protein